MIHFVQFLISYSLYRLTPRDFNSYGARRGNDAVMARGTFANIRLLNKFIGRPGPRTIYIPNKEEVSLRALHNSKIDVNPVGFSTNHSLGVK